MTSLTRWSPGEVVVWRSVRRGVVGTARPMRVVRDSAELIALYLCPGTRSQGRKGRRGGPRGRMMLSDGWSGEYEERVWTGHRVLVLHRPGDGHSVLLFWRQDDPALRSWYINLEEPWRRTALGFDSCDQILDLGDCEGGGG